MDCSTLEYDDLGLVNCAGRDCGCELLGERTHAKIAGGKCRVASGVALPPPVAMRAGGRPYCLGCATIRQPKPRERKGWKVDGRKRAKAEYWADDFRDHRDDKRVDDDWIDGQSERERVRELNRQRMRPESVALFVQGGATPIWDWFACRCARTGLPVGLVGRLDWDVLAVEDLGVNAPLQQCLEIILEETHQSNDWLRVSGDDVRQEALLVVLVRMHFGDPKRRYDPAVGPLRPWLVYRINTAFNHVRDTLGFTKKWVKTGAAGDERMRRQYHQWQVPGLCGPEDENGDKQRSIDLNGTDYRFWSPADTADRRIGEKETWAMIERLCGDTDEGKLELQVVRLLAGFDGQGEMTYEEIDEALDIAGGSARNIWRRFERRIEGNPEIAERLRQRCEETNEYSDGPRHEDFASPEYVRSEQYQRAVRDTDLWMSHSPHRESQDNRRRAKRSGAGRAWGRGARREAGHVVCEPLAAGIWNTDRPDGWRLHDPNRSSEEQYGEDED